MNLYNVICLKYTVTCIIDFKVLQFQLSDCIVDYNIANIKSSIIF